MVVQRRAIRSDEGGEGLTEKTRLLKPRVEAARRLLVSLMTEMHDSQLSRK